MAQRWITAMVLGLALVSCSGAGSRQFSGVWLYEFEGSTFVEGATAIPRERPDYKTADWLELVDWRRADALLDHDPGNSDCHMVQPFLVTFVGRRTHRPFGGAGHWGLWRSEVTVQRQFSAQRLGRSFCYEP